MSARTTADWDARTYDRLAAPQEQWAGEVLERLPLSGEETVLDAGCGTGRVTRLLLDRLPEGRVVGVDGSPSMIELAGDALGADERVSLILSDLLEFTPELLREHAGTDRVDVVFSNATFHWIADHERLFERLAALLRPGGRLVAQCGGRGNVENWIRAVRAAAAEPPFSEHLDGFEPWNFYGPEETEDRLRAAGFERPRCWLEHKPTITPEDPRNFVSVVGLASLHEKLPDGLRERFTDAVYERLPPRLELRYVRLNIEATRRG